MRTAVVQSIHEIVKRNEADLLTQWLLALSEAGALAGGRIKEAELRLQCRNVLDALIEAMATGNLSDIDGPGYDRMRDLLAEVSRSRAVQGFSPSETATFILSLKQPIFHRLNTELLESDPKRAVQDAWASSLLLDQLGLFVMESYQQSRESVIIRQQQEIAELSTPVVKLWAGVLALPLIGTLDSSRTQVVMENLLQSIVEHSAAIAIIDITGVPTVDTLVAQHLLKTVAAARLMGADCIVSGVRPQIAQTMVHLGVELNVTSKATMADAFALALQRTGKTVVSVERRGRD